MKKAILILGDGSTITLEGRFVLLTETAGDKPELSVVTAYRKGAQKGSSVICDSLMLALDFLRENRRAL